MTKTIRFSLVLLFITVNSAFSSISEYTKNMDKSSGYFDYYWDKKTGRLLLEVDKFNQDVLYINALQSGLGSNDIGLDRGQIGDRRVVQFQRFGNKILMTERNLYYRAISENEMEVKAVEDGFAQSVILGSEILAESNDSTLIDLTNFLLRDSHGVSTRLAEMEQGNYQADSSRSVIYIQNCKNFPENTELEALITFQGSNPGNYVRSVTPTAETISLRTHHSFVKLPDEPYKSRKYHIRSGAIALEFKNYAAPLGEDLTTKLVIRHKLEKKNPELAVSDPIEPIVYYLDPGTPEPVRSALLEGASWWKDGFEAVGFSNAFEVKLLPEDADSLDIRYNTIQWVHRATRGWSYGDSIVDPRSGEILKGHVSLGSLRVRQDMLIAQGLLSPFKNSVNSEERIEQMALARLRQLSAHEVGHTIGLTHNFAASTNNRASVMDYPHPLIEIDNDDNLDLTNAYAIGVGDWDKTALSYIYGEFQNDENQQLDNILKNAQNKGLKFISDVDARAAGGSHPDAHLWDNGGDSIEELAKVLKVRKIALNNFGLNTLKDSDELFKLEQLLTPIYLFHRYQTEAVTKLIGGVNYTYAMKGDKNPESQLVDAQTQRKATAILMKTLQADEMSVPQNLLNLLLPPPDNSSRNREHFKSRTGLHFDALGAAETAAKQTLELLLNPNRANRLIEHHARNNSIPSLDELIQTIIENTWHQNWKNEYFNEVQNSINSVVLTELMRLAASDVSSKQTTAIVHQQLKKLEQSLKKDKSAFAKQARLDISNYFEKGFNEITQPTKEIPPGSPIGMQ